MNIKIEDLPNGWQRIIFSAEVEVTPKWWQFRKKRIEKQTVQFSTYLKPGKNGKEIVAYAPNATYQ